MEILNLFGVAPGEHVYTGGGEWREWIWGYTDEPHVPDYRVHCEFCGTVLHDPFDPEESLFSRRNAWHSEES